MKQNCNFYAWEAFIFGPFKFFELNLPTWNFGI